MNIENLTAQQRVDAARELLATFEQQVADDFTHNDYAHRQVAKYRRMLRELEMEAAVAE